MAISKALTDREWGKFKESSTTSGQVGTVVVNPDGSNVGAASVDGSTFTPGTSTGSVIEALYEATPTTVADGKVGAVGIDTNRNLKVTLGTRIAGENLTDDLTRIEPKYNFLNIVLAAPTTTTVKSGAGVLHSIVFNKMTASGVVTIYDNTAGSGTLIATITNPATLLKNQDGLLYDIAFSTGLTLVTSVAAQDITVSYR